MDENVQIVKNACDYYDASLKFFESLTETFPYVVPKLDSLVRLF